MPRSCKARPQGGLFFAEIAENLHRREIGEIERAELIAKWVALQEARRDQSAQVAPNEAASKREDGRGHRKPSGIRAAARDLGMTRDAVSRAVKVASLSPEAKDAARAAGLGENQQALLAAAKAKTPEKQVAAIRRRVEEYQ